MSSARIAVIGSFVQDLAFTVETFPAPGETRIGNFFTGPGGKGSNQAVAAHRQKVPTIFIGAVGNDLFGHGYREWTQGEGLPTSLLTDPTAPTGAASIVVNAHAENSIVVALGANENLTAEHTLNTLAKNLELSILLLQAESNLDAAQAALTHGRARGIFSIFNPAPINPAVSKDLLSYADCITPNETEASYLIERISGRRCSTDFATLSDDAIRECCDVLPASTVVLTLGSSGSLLYQRGAPHPYLRNVAKGEIVRTEPLSITPVDTTGAGDAFNGGLAAGLIRFSGDIKQAIRYATVVAGLSTTRAGTAPAMPSLDEVETYRSFYE
jgi:ribokinase